MRVIAGTYKGRQLKTVAGRATRPTTDKVKEAVFQRIGPFFDGGKCLDLFAGSGSLGIEALSRGMDAAIFVDKQPRAIQTIYENLNMLGLRDRCEVFRTDAYRALRAAAKRKLQFKLILLDPPYKMVDYEELLTEITALNLLDTNGTIYCEHDVSEKLPPSTNRLVQIKQETYGSTIGITIYQGQ